MTNLSFRALGTDINIEIMVKGKQSVEKAKKDLEETRKIYSSKQKIFCRFNPESELSRFNKDLNVFREASKDFLDLAERALFYNRASFGIYDPRVIGVLEKIGYHKDFRSSDFAQAKVAENFDKIERELSDDLKIRDGNVLFAARMDFSGIAKGYVTDCVAKFLMSRGWKNFLIDSGGDMYAAGKNAAGENWKISVEGISEKKLMLEISDRGIATSGISRKKWEIGGKKYHHLINPKDPHKFSFELRTVTVIERNTENADGRAKVLMLLGKEKGMEFAKKNKTAAIFFDYKGNVLVSPEAKKYIAK